MTTSAETKQRARARRAIEGELGRIAQRQLGLITRAQALACGLTGNQVDARLRAGKWRRLLPGVYAQSGVPDGWRLRALAAALWAGGDAVLARGSAARVHELPVPAAALDRLHLLVAQRRLAPQDGIVVHRTRRRIEEHMTIVGPFPVTTPTRTVCDLAGELSAPDLRAVVAAAVRAGATDALDLRTTLSRLGRVRGAARLRDSIDELSPLDAQCRSELETLYLRVARRGGVEPTAMNLPIRDDEGRRRYLDAAYLPERLPVELDGKQFHSNTLDVNDDVRRASSIVATGAWHPPLRFTWEDLTERPERVVQTVRAALVAARACPLPPS